MTKAKTGVFLSMGRLPQIVGQAALAASVLAGGVSLLNAGGAIAVACDGTNGASFDITGTYTSCSSPVGSPPAGNAFVSIDTKFNPELVGPTSGINSYSLTSSQGPFIAGLIDSDFDLGTGTVQKQVYGGSSSGPLIFDQISTNGSPSGLIGFSNTSYNTIYVKDTYSVNAGGQLDNFTNTFQTPGPLPILGAGAAFGFSRKLRGRIKAARLG
jgi:hypothetical protein